MISAQHRTDLRIWLMISVVLHSLMLALPEGLLEAVFPTKAESVAYMPGDLTPDFEETAISVVGISEEVRYAPAEIAPVGQPDLPPVREPPKPGSGNRLPRPSSGAGDSDSPADTRYFPPVPRLIVPPDLHGLKMSSIDLQIRILVGEDGRPVTIELPDTLSNGETRRRLLKSAQRFRFDPARSGDTPVRAWITLPLQVKASANP